MNTQFKKGSLELCVLSLLSREDMYGYEIVSKISPRIEVTESTIYPLLRRLTKDDYLTTYVKDSSEGPQRKYYRLTESGITYYNSMAAQWREFINEVNYFIEGGANND